MNFLTDYERGVMLNVINSRAVFGTRFSIKILYKSCQQLPMFHGIFMTDFFSANNEFLFPMEKKKIPVLQQTLKITFFPEEKKSIFYSIRFFE